MSHEVKWAEVDVGVLRENTAALCRLVGPEVALMAMIKANGYGHGAVLAAGAALQGGARWLGVSSADEALQLRCGGITAPILVVGWTRPQGQPELVGAGVDLTVCDGAGVSAVAAAARQAGRRGRVHVKIDSGMGRLGVRPEQLPALVEALSGSLELVELVGIFTHFADADGSDPSFTEEQHDRFLELAGQLRRLAPAALLHCANSAATIRLPRTRHQLVRPGIALYGYPPVSGGDELRLRPAMTMVALITQVKTIHAGDTVGYGRSWRAPGDTRIAIVAAGYADGVQRAQSNRGALLIGGRRCPIVGRVSMDQLAVDVSGVERVEPGDEAVLFGSREGTSLGADEVAGAAGTIPYEVLCTVSARVPRVAVGGVEPAP